MGHSYGASPKHGPMRFSSCEQAEPSNELLAKGLYLPESDSDCGSPHEPDCEMKPGVSRYKMLGNPWVSPQSLVLLVGCSDTSRDT